MNIQLINPQNASELQERNGKLVDLSGNSFPFVNGAYRFARDNNYTENFGFQWNKFERTQIDRFQKNVDQSRKRFFSVTHWESQDLTSQNILEVGSGAGRFSQIILQHTKANLYSVDYSNAVEANYRNNGPNPRMKLFQASIYELPFVPAQFDKVFCFGVLQHTPDFKKSVESLVAMVKPGGELIVDFYPIKGWYTKIHAKYLFRPFLKKMTNERLLKKIDSNADWLITLYNFFERIKIGRLMNRFLPICDISRTIPAGLDKATLREWVVLDTFDMFSPEFDSPQKLETVIKWFKEFHMKDVMGQVVTYEENRSVTMVRGRK